MTGTSVRKMVEVDLSQLSREDRIAMLRSRMQQVGAVSQESLVPAETVPLPSELGAAIAGGGLPKQMVTHLSDTPALAAELLAKATKEGAYAAVVGWSDLVLSSVVEAGGNLERMVVIPDPGLEPLNTVAVLTEGMDLVMYRHPVQLELSPVRARPMLGKLRNGNAALVLVNASVASPAISMQAQVVGYHGIGKGTGRIHGVELEVRVQQKGSGRSVVTLPVGRIPKQHEAKPRLKAV